MYQAPACSPSYGVFLSVYPPVDGLGAEVTKSEPYRFWTAASAALLVLAVGPARAADASPQPAPSQNFSWLDEIAVGVFDHDWMRKPERGTLDGKLEAFTSPVYRASTGFTPLDQMLSPRLNAGVSINSANKTSFAYVGPAWRIDAIGPIFVDGEFGMAANDYHSEPDGQWLDMGSRVTFHEEIGLGVRLTDHIDAMASLEHISHAGLFGHPNPVLSDFGFRLGYRF